MKQPEYPISEWTISAGLDFGGLPKAANLRPEFPVIDLLRAHEVLTRQHRLYWAALDARFDGTDK